jgi:hypothetical protein
MNLQRFALSAMLLAIGYAMTAALYWALLNIPESNVLALLVSAVLVLLVAIAGGVTTGMALALAQGARSADAGRRAIAALPSFFAGVVIFGALWWLTGFAEAWWRGHRGEVDAVFLRYMGTARTGPLHQSVLWVIFLARWALGLSVVAALIAAGISGGRLATIGRDLRSIRMIALGAACAGVIAVTQGLWRLVFWRPQGLPASGVELVFVTAKLMVLYALAISIANAVLWVHRSGTTT